MQAFVLYGLFWLVFGLLHSLLAARSVKRYLQSVTSRWYRLFYNLFAALHTMAILGLGMWLYQDMPPFALSSGVRLLLSACLVSGVAVCILAAREYDLGVFSGISPRGIDSEALCTDGLHRYVRHPLYSGMLLVLLGLAQSPFGAATALYGGLYLLLGTVSEEVKLVDLYGESYRQYRRAVPAFLPWRGRVMLRNR